jgi:hypothetical protein
MHPAHHQNHRSPIMQLTTERATLNLPRNHTARLTRARDTHVKVVDGVAWITIDGQQRDIVLERGQSVVIDSNGDVIVFALQGPASVELGMQ